LERPLLAADGEEARPRKFGKPSRRGNAAAADKYRQMGALIVDATQPVAAVAKAVVAMLQPLG
jgi:hypothetical protein